MEEQDLLPLLATSVQHRNEDSVDFTREEPRRQSEARETQQIWGIPSIDTQGHAGSRVPDLDDRPLKPQPWPGNEAERAYRYQGDDDAPPDAEGPHSPVDAEMVEAEYEGGAGEAAVAAVTAARRRGCANNSAAMLDVLEAAEDAYYHEEQHQQQETTEAQHQKQHGWQGPSSGYAASAAAALNADEAPPPDPPRKAAIAEGTRERIIQALFESLRANPSYASKPARDVQALACEVEDALFASCHSKQVYLSKVSNAVRLARSEADANDIPRIASGEPREVAEGHTAGEASPYVAGLQGYVLKPDMLS